MVNNFTNIYKTNNHLSPKESLNIDGQQFHQYLQNKQSPLTWNHCIKDFNIFTISILLLVNYILGLTNKKLNRLEDALDCFYKLHAILRNSPQVMYQIADMYPLLFNTSLHRGQLLLVYITQQTK
jgi:hypothetical protein